VAVRVCEPAPRMGEEGSSTRPPLRTLLVEDNPDDAELILMELRRGGREPIARRVKTAAQMTACPGVSTRVVTTVAIELAASWKPLT